jgi:hypothetical protein
MRATVGMVRHNKPRPQHMCHASHANRRFILSEAESAQPPVKATRSRGFRWLVALVVVAGIAWFLYTPRQVLKLGNGRRYELLQWDRNLSVTINPRSGTQTSEQRFLVVYYSDSTGLEPMRREARAMAPFITQFADTLGVNVMVIRPTTPILTRAFPLARRSWQVRYERDSAGVWTEK